MPCLVNKRPASFTSPIAICHELKAILLKPKIPITREPRDSGCSTANPDSQNIAEASQSPVRPATQGHRAEERWLKVLWHPFFQRVASVRGNDCPIGRRMSDRLDAGEADSFELRTRRKDNVQIMLVAVEQIINPGSSSPLAKAGSIPTYCDPLNGRAWEEAVMSFITADSELRSRQCVAHPRTTNRTR
jgi:hypothetical protein